MVVDREVMHLDIVQNVAMLLPWTDHVSSEVLKRGREEEVVGIYGNGPSSCTKP